MLEATSSDSKWLKEVNQLGALRFGVLIPTMASSSTAVPIQTYSNNERVLCYHGPLIYEAKVLKGENWDESSTKIGTTGPHYFVHYKGWKQT